MNIYCDESCKDAHRYMAIGALCIEDSDMAEVQAALQVVRDQYKRASEVKWTKLRPSLLPFYKEFVDVFFDYSAKDVMHFRGMYVDTRTFRHREYNGGDHDLGFSKMIFQLLLHKFGRHYGKTYKFHVYLDSRCTRHQPEEMRPMLNAKLRDPRWNIDTDPFRRVTFQDSEKSDLVQLADLLTGSIGATKNGHHKLPNAAEYKNALREHIIKRAIENEPTGRLNWISTKRFYVWKFQFT